ncbi:MAG: SIS domain-containing protein [Methanobrevibacter sp.]|nr:SIS domain-containing protein [Methanobrevibacter sp.]
MSQLKYMDLSLDEILKNADRCKLVVENQKEAIVEFKEIIKTASNKRTSKNPKTTIFLVGAGRSGFVAKAFAMRLMHLGYYVYVVGETITPWINDGDIIITVSKSGKSNSITEIIGDSELDNVKFLSICGSEDCDLAGISDAKIIIESLPQNCIELEGDLDPLELILMGCAFEISAFIILDALVCELMQNLNLREKDLKDYHDVLSSSI